MNDTIEVADGAPHPAPTNNPARQFGVAIRERVTLEQQLALDACLGCGQCGSACAWYLETGDQERHPLHRKNFLRKAYRQAATFRGRLGGKLGLAEELGEQELSARMESFWKCTSCGRCTLACPLSLSNRSAFRLAREAYSACGMSARNQVRRSIIENTMKHGNSFGMTPEHTLLRLAFHLGIERTDVPLDRHGADYLLVVPTVDVGRFPGQLFRLFQLLNAAGLSYTLSSQVTDLGTEADHVIVDRALSVRMLERVEEEARRLEVSALLVPECGCDVRTFYVDAPEILGRALTVPVRWVDSVLLDAITNGSLQVGQLRQRITLHDPCQITRLAGMGALVRRLVATFAPDYVEMTPNGAHNHCCNGSSGPMRLPENTELRRRVSRLKIAQIEQTEAEFVVSPCAVCTVTLNDICQFYGLSVAGQRKARMLYELLHEALMLRVAGERAEERLRSPPGESAATDHQQTSTLRTWLDEFRLEPAYTEAYAWLTRDDSVVQATASSSRARLVLEEFAPGRRFSDIVGLSERGDVQCRG